MSGFYIHIPFCSKRCHYCDFYSNTNLNLRESFVEALLGEIRQRKDYLPDPKIDTIYFGGGTPSLLSPEHFEKIFAAIQADYMVSENAEITFEANPDDLTPEYLSSLADLPFNRISIGIQSFDDNDLKRLNRRHSGEEARQSVQHAKDAGFKNISIDLIYGLPFQTIEGWQEQLQKALDCGVQHISAYGLTYEEGTVLWKQLKNNSLQPVDEDTMNKMYFILRETLQKSGYEAYEISNFALSGFRSRHNSSYWKQIPYLGVGPSAHSYDGDSRQWNVPSLPDYIKGIQEGNKVSERECLSVYERYNDFILLSLRTSEGLNLTELEARFGSQLKQYCLQNIKTFIETEKVNYEGDVIRLYPEGILISDMILAELMWI